jgi:hypothetical protein
MSIDRGSWNAGKLRQFPNRGELLFIQDMTNRILDTGLRLFAGVFGGNSSEVPLS